MMPDNSCIETDWGRLPFGYGVKYRKGRLLYHHRVVWENVNGPIPEGLFVLHKCDNPSCIRLDHLFLGTKKDNTQDMWKKGRGKIPGAFKKGMPQNVRYIRGEKHHFAKLTDRQVEEIRKELSVKPRPYGSITAISKKYGVSVVTVHRIINQEGYREVKNEIV